MAVLVGEVTGAVDGVTAEVIGRGGFDDGAVAVDELEVELEAGAGAGGTLADPESVINGVVGAVAEFGEGGVDLADQGLVVQVVAPDRAGMGVAAIEILSVILF